MPDRQKEDKPRKSVTSIGEVVLRSPGEVTVQHDDLPTKVADNKNIHLRRPLPLVPESNDDQSDELPTQEP